MREYIPVSNNNTFDGLHQVKRVHEKWIVQRGRNKILNPPSATVCDLMIGRLNESEGFAGNTGSYGSIEYFTRKEMRINRKKWNDKGKKYLIERWRIVALFTGCHVLTKNCWCDGRARDKS